MSPQFSAADVANARRAFEDSARHHERSLDGRQTTVSLRFTSAVLLGWAQPALSVGSVAFDEFDRTRARLRKKIPKRFSPPSARRIFITHPNIYKSERNLKRVRCKYISRGKKKKKKRGNKQKK
jgi:hypothetical protein